jgi:anti-sigma regulatory factor (Ser/Thr protein kinase)
VSQFRLEVPSDPACMKIVRSSVESLCSMAGLSENESCKVVLAIDEACTNIIRHSYDGVYDKPIICQGKLENHKLLFVLQDYGKKVDPSKVRSRELADVRPGGLGVHFIQEVMDRMEFEDCGEEGTRLFLEKKIPESGA